MSNMILVATMYLPVAIMGAGAYLTMRAAYTAPIGVLLLGIGMVVMRMSPV